jgi:KTSC domain
MPAISHGILQDLLKFRMFSKNQTASDCVADITYNPETQEMIVDFQQRGTYSYSGVPIDEYTNFQLSGSQGKYFNTYIRNRYAFERVG